MKTLKGKFKPKYPKKYKGNPSNIIFRSSWELRCMEFFDRAESVIWWQSEERSIAYMSPETNSIRRYFPDFIIHVKTKKGKLETHMIEVKPHHQTIPPKNRKSKKLLSETVKYAVNAAKWNAAKQFCEKRGWEFVILTEKEIFGNKYM